MTVLSQTLRKKADALRLGADHVHATADPATFTELAGTFDLILNTVSATIDLDAHLGLVTTDGTLVNLGAPDHPSTVNMQSLIGGRKSLAGSLVGGIPQTQEMLNFCAEHGFGAEIEVIRADQINEAYERVLASDVRYRFVVDIASLRA